MIQPSLETFQHRAGDGDHERALRKALGQSGSSRLVERILEGNQIIPHNFLVEVERPASCAHPGCTEPFVLKLVPGQIVYPKWCDFHRPAHRRKMAAIPPRGTRSWEDSLETGLRRV